MSKVCVAGLGKLGACMAAVLASRGHSVVGFDVVPKTVELMNNAVAPCLETGLNELLDSARPNLSATVSPYEAVRGSTIAFIIVPTPSGDDGTFINDYVIEAVSALAGELRDWQDYYTFVVCSTVMPGACDGPIRQAIEQASGRTVGVDVGLCYSPEFIALGSVIRDMTHPDMVLIGANDETSRSAATDVLCTIPNNQPDFANLSLIDAEIAKLAVNTYITMKISYANTLGELCERISGANARIVAHAIGHDKRIGHRYLAPGAAYGGPCFPRDTAAFAALARSVNVGPELAEATDVVNRRQVLNLMERLVGYDQVSVLGLAYKPGTPVIERSFGRELVELLQFEGIVVHTYDRKMKEPINGNNACMEPQHCIDSADVVVITTPELEFAELNFKGKTVFDLWGVLNSRDHNNVLQLIRFGVAA